MEEDKTEKILSLCKEDKDLKREIIKQLTKKGGDKNDQRKKTGKS